eukprot:scaffold30229_cov146-Isochrysis_galbana.AAC.3
MGRRRGSRDGEPGWEIGHSRMLTRAAALDDVRDPPGMPPRRQAPGGGRTRVGKLGGGGRI